MPKRMTDSFEFRLAALRPAPAAVGQASFYYRAGQVSQERAVRRWQFVAAAAAILMTATVGLCGWRVAEAEARVADAEAKRVLPTVVAVPAEIPPTLPPLSASADDDLRPYAPPMMPPKLEAGPTSGEVASSLELRRNILTAGVSYLDAQPKRTQSHFPESSGVPKR